MRFNWFVNWWSWKIGFDLSSISHTWILWLHFGPVNFWWDTGRSTPAKLWGLDYWLEDERE